MSRFKVGDKVKWVGPIQTVGPYKEVAIKPGDVREVLAVNAAGDVVLTRSEPGGFYGAVNPCHLELVGEPKNDMTFTVRVRVPAGWTREQARDMLQSILSAGVDTHAEYAEDESDGDHEQQAAAAASEAHVVE